MMDGRLKTLHPNIFGGILANRSKPDHMTAIEEQGINPIDIVVVNLYDFNGKPGIENIDIGGPSLLRAAAKNGAHVLPIVDPLNYDDIIGQIIKSGNVDRKTREKLIIDVFEHTYKYDTAINKWMVRQYNKGGGFLQ